MCASISIIFCASIYIHDSNMVIELISLGFIVFVTYSFLSMWLYTFFEVFKRKHRLFAVLSKILRVAAFYKEKPGENDFATTFDLTIVPKKLKKEVHKTEQVKTLSKIGSPILSKLGSPQMESRTPMFDLNKRKIPGINSSLMGVLKGDRLNFEKQRLRLKNLRLDTSPLKI